MGVQIKINYDRCRFSMYDPKGCKKCLQICPQAVLATQPLKRRDFSIPKEQRVEPMHWKLVVSWDVLCTACNACVETCPEKAISVITDDQL